MLHPSYVAWLRPIGFAGTSDSPNKASFCHCRNGYFAPHGETTCHNCPSGGNCAWPDNVTRSNERPPSCKPGALVCSGSVTAKTGYWHPDQPPYWSKEKSEFLKCRLTINDGQSACVGYNNSHPDGCADRRQHITTIAY